MKLPKQCCNVHQGQKLKQLGVLQESLFYHTHSKFGVLPKKSIDFTGNPTSAFTVAELVQMNENCSGINWSEKDKKFYIQTSHDEAVEFSKRFTYFPTFAQACAHKLINAIQEEWVTVEEVNRRLNS